MGGVSVAYREATDGTVLKGQVYIEKGVNDSYMIVVGQRGVSPCNANPSFNLCQNPPLTFNEAISCNNLVSNISSRGGGGGGGGSMIWVRNATGQYSDDVLPLVAAAGGGGTSAKLNYSNIYDYDGIPAENRTLKLYYIDWINGQSIDEDGLNEGNPGNVGNRPSMNSAGSGSGWVNNIEIQSIQNIDGSLLSQSENFAKGGQDCPNNSPAFINVTGGFGGGGGACSDGGGGGGYGGGWVVLPGGPTIPGRGGYSLNSEFNGEILESNSGEGYVKIVPLDCGCSNKECIINGDVFECQCPLGRLAGDGFHCITGMYIYIFHSHAPAVWSLTISHM